MDVIVQIPDNIARHMREANGELARRVLEAFALEEFKKDRRLLLRPLRDVVDFMPLGIGSRHGFGS